MAETPGNTAGNTAGNTVGNTAGGALGALGTTKITKEEVANMGGSLRVHIRLNLEVDVRVIAKLKGDIAIGLL